MLLRKTLSIFLLAFSLTLPVLGSAKEEPAPAHKNKPSIDSKAKLLARGSESYNLLDLDDVVEIPGNSLMNINPFLISPDEFEEIVTSVESEREISLYPPITNTLDSYQNYFEPGHKVQRILQELLPLNIF